MINIISILGFHSKIVPSQMSDQASATEMLPLELTLVVAATRNMGIGRAGTLPWTGLKKEMAYFARVTKRLPVTVGFHSARLTKPALYMPTRGCRHNHHP